MTRPRKPRISVNVIDWAYHRNGISGAPFHVVLFDDEDDENSQKSRHSVRCIRTIARCSMSPSFQLEVSAFGFNSYRGEPFRGRPSLPSSQFLQPERSNPL